MSDWASREAPTPLFIGAMCGQWTPVSDLRSIVSGSLSAATWVANLAVFIPLAIPWPYMVRRVFWTNGSTITAGNVDMGVYSADGELVLHCGTTAQSGATANQYAAALTPKLLKPGRYYLAFVCDHTTAYVGAYTAWSVANLRMVGVLQQALASASLPAAMTGATIANALYPACGITQSASGF